MPKTDKEKPISRLTKEAFRESVASNIAGMPKKDFGPGDHLKTIAQVAGMPRGTKVEVKEAQHGGAMFVVEVLTGPRSKDGDKPAEIIRIAAPDLELFKSKAQLEKEERERLERLGL